MNHFSIKLYNIILNLLNKKHSEKDIFNLKNIMENKNWKIDTKYNITNIDNDFKNKSIKFSKKTLIDSLELTFTDNTIHMFFYHKNTSKDPYYITNAYVFGETVSLDNIDKLKQCLQLVQ